MEILPFSATPVHNPATGRNPFDVEQRYLEALRGELEDLRLRDPANFDVRRLEREVEIQQGVVNRIAGSAG